jgi:uncharacterized protein YehS (DUF1456 family)
MTNNDILRRLRYTFDLDDNQVIAIFALAGLEVNKAQISEWLKKDDDPDYKPIYDPQLAVFLTGFIIHKRGKKEGEEPKSEKKLNNNIVFRKLKIALSLKDEDITEILELVDFRMSKHELSAFFRNPTQNQYRPCKDQVLRNFIHGLQVRYHLSD